MSNQYQPLALRLDGASLMLGERVLASSTKDSATAAAMKRLAEYFPGDREMENNVRYVLREIPAVLSLEKITDAEQIIKSYCREWTAKQTHNVAMLVYKKESKEF